MELLFYLDESGNTGDAIAKHGVEDSFAGQPSFALAGVGAFMENELEQIVQNLKRKHNVYLSELKASRLFIKKPKFIQELVQTLVEKDYPLFIELMDKRYFIAVNIVLFYLLHVLTVKYPLFQGYARDLAGLISEQLDDVVLIEFSEFCRFPSKEKLVQFTQLFRKEVLATFDKVPIDSDLLKQVTLIVTNGVLEAEQNNELDEDIFERFLPPPDRNNKGEIIAMLPHTSAFTNMYARINRFVDDDMKIRIIHDEQARIGEILKVHEDTLRTNQLTNILQKLTWWDKNVNYKFTGKSSLEFTKSNTSIGIQVADILAGFCTRYFNKIKANQVEEVRCHHITIELLKSVYSGDGRGLNIVASDASIERFYSPF
ncbi:DUF3800 domain-containing protein [Desmonostoc muscorum CCALA 125]|nr:DUF3800 domain-containing protein [Desmonostoc muscorum CCALA 125]